MSQIAILSSLGSEGASRIRNSLVIEGSQIGIWDWNIQTGETYFNEYWAEIIGYTIEELQPISIDTWMKFAHPEDLEKSNELLEKHFRGETEFYEFESRMKHKDGHWVWVLDRGKVFEWDKDGNPMRMCGSHTDLTQIKMKERALRDAKLKLEKIFGIIDVGILITDKNTNIIDCNTASEHMLGISREDFLGKSDIDNEWKFIRRDFTEMPLQEYPSSRALEENRTIKNVEIGVVKKEAQITWLTVSATPLDIDGVGVLIAFKDITFQILAQDELKEASRTKDKFLSIIAHDLRSPFSGIMGLTDLASMSLSENKPGETEEYLGYIRQSTQQGSMLISNLLQWSQIQSKRIEFQPESIHLNKNIQHNVSFLYSNIKAKDLQMHVEQEDDIFVTGDSYMVNTIIRNLISNAIKYSNRGSKISVSVSKRNTYALISVTDEGTGISQSKLDNLFSIKNSYSEAGTDGEKGTGLGLILCKEFVEKNGGEISAKSTLGEGSSFYFTLPLRN